MLQRDYKFHIVNNTGATIEFSTDGANNSFTILASPWKAPAGVLEYGSEQTWFADPTADLTDGASLEASSAVDNSSNLWMGAHCIATLVTDAATDGTLQIYYEYSTDGGTTFPSDAADFDITDLIPAATLASVSPDEDRTVNFELY